MQKRVDGDDVVTPILKGTASRLGLRKPQPSLVQRIAHFSQRCLGVRLDPWQLYALDLAYAHYGRPETEYLAHFEIHADGRIVDNTERLRARGNGNANL